MKEVETMAKFCPKCRTANKEEDLFCKKCGAALEPVERAEIRKRFCPQCGAEVSEEDTFCNRCGTRMSGLSMKKANAGARFGSWIIDIIILNVIGFIVGAVLGLLWALTFPYEEEALLGISYLLGIMITIGYYTYFFGNGQTLGMKVVRIKLCGTDGTYPVGYGRGFLRWVGMFISALVIGLGFLWILIDENKQGWHDKIADTYVVEA
jgi:uncharacterized RDD family membrane protein YckC